MAISELPGQFFPSWDRSRAFFTENFRQYRESVQESTEKAFDRVTQASDRIADLSVRAVDRMTQATDVLTSNTKKTVETMTTATGDSVKSMTEAISQTKNTASEAMQTAFTSSVGDWLQAHPVAFRLVQMLSWAANHPIWSLILLLFAIAIALIIIKAIGRLIEFASLSILRVPLKLIQGFFKVSLLSFSQINNLIGKQLFNAKVADSILPPTTIPQSETPQRLSEISTRLTELQQEQNQLLQEIAALMTADNRDV